ncbi:MAG: hypothetical protein DRP83_05100 [Planctomycetota bacterium]|nr:MAG: hypothetical protein DRP83_05100 [Planctomycetota bacterium]
MKYMKSTKFFFLFFLFFVIPARAEIHSFSCHSSGKFETRRAPLDSRSPIRSRTSFAGMTRGAVPMATPHAAAV